MYFTRTSLRISFWYALSFVIASILIFVLTGLFLARSLQIKDRELLESKFQAYREIVELEGIKGLRSNSANKKIPDSEQFYVRLADSHGKTLFLHIPEDPSDAPDEKSIRQLEEFLSKHSESGWSVFKGEHYGDDIELISRSVGDSTYLQVGKDTEEREGLLRDYLQSFITVIVPILILAFVFGFLLSAKLLTPIRWLTMTVNGIREGRTSERVPLRGNNDELDKLGNLFNQMLDQNELLMKGMTEIVDNVAHDLRTPVMRLRSGVETALASKGTIEEANEALSDVLENSDVILNILNAIMDIFEAKVGALRLEKQVVQVDKILEDVADLYSYIAEEKKIKIEFVAQSWLSVVGDRTRLLQAVANLADNAIKYSPENTVISFSAILKNGFVEIHIADRGPGIMAADREKIWERFYRGDASRSSRGLGLGLSLVSAIVQSHGGTVVTTEREGGGSIFKIILPAA